MSARKRNKGKAKFKQKPSLESRVIKRVKHDLKHGITPSENTPLKTIIGDCKAFVKEVLGYHYPLVVMSDFIEKKAIQSHDLNYDAVKNTLSLSRITAHLAVVDKIEEDVAHMEVLDIAEELKTIAQSAADAFAGATPIYPQFVAVLKKLAEDHNQKSEEPVSINQVINIYAIGWISELLTQKTDVEVVDE